MPEVLTEGAVMAAPAPVEEPERHRDIASPILVGDPKLAGRTVSITLVLTTPACPLTGPLQEAAEAAPLAIPGRATAVLAQPDLRQGEAVVGGARMVERRPEAHRPVGGHDDPAPAVGCLLLTGEVDVPAHAEVAADVTRPRLDLLQLRQQRPLAP